MIYMNMKIWMDFDYQCWWGEGRTLMRYHVNPFKNKYFEFQRVNQNNKFDVKYTFIYLLTICLCANKLIQANLGKYY